MSDGTPFLRVAADRIGAPGSPAKMPFRATNAANWSSIIRIGAKMAVIRRQIARRAVSSHTQRAGKVPSGESRLRALGETAMARVKRLNGGKLNARTFQSQQTEIAMQIDALNRSIREAKPKTIRIR